MCVKKLKKIIRKILMIGKYVIVVMVKIKLRCSSSGGSGQRVHITGP